LSLSLPPDQCFLSYFFGVGIGDGHPKVDLLARIFGNLSKFFSKQQKNGNLLLGIVEKWWHFFENENFFSFLCEFYEKTGMCNNIFQFYFSFFLGGSH
jgi:AAA+ ATPase superfamily predicted ATPase